MIAAGIALLCLWLMFIEKQLVRIADTLERLEEEAGPHGKEATAGQAHGTQAKRS